MHKEQKALEVINTCAKLLYLAMEIEKDLMNIPKPKENETNAMKIQVFTHVARIKQILAMRTSRWTQRLHKNN